MACGKNEGGFGNYSDMKARIIIGLSLFLLVGGVHGQELNRDSVPTTHIYDKKNYKRVGEEPAFPGGRTAFLRFVEKNYSFPMESWEEDKIVAGVNLQFIVRKDGVACGLRYNRMSSGMYEEFLRLFRMMPLWEPGKIKGIPVDMKCSIFVDLVDETGLPLPLAKQMKKIKKSFDLNRKYKKGIEREEVEELAGKMKEIAQYAPDNAKVFVALTKLNTSLGKNDDAVAVGKAGMEEMQKMLSKRWEEVKNRPAIFKGMPVQYMDAYDGRLYVDAALNHALACDAAGDEEEARKAYEDALNVVDERIFLKDIKVPEEDVYGNEMYRRLLGEKQVLAAASQMPGVTLGASERAAMFNHGWVTSESMRAIDRNIAAGKVDNPRIRQINTQLEEMNAERRKAPALGKDSLYLYGLRALVIELGEGGEAVNRYVDAMNRRADVSPKLKDYLSELLERRQKHASLLDDREAVARSLAEYAPLYGKEESKRVRKQRAREFYRYRDAVKSVYPLE